MASMSDWLEGQIRAHIFRTASFTKPTVLAIALCSSAPADDDDGSSIPELANANGYARVTLNPSDSNWTAASASDGETDNAVAITFPAVTTSDWAAVTHVAILDSATYGAGNLLFWGTITRPDTSPIGAPAVGDVLSIGIGQISATFD